jgi:hypothetical protein
LSFNIARSYEKIGDDAGALRWYRDYLRRDPSVKNAGDVQKLVQGLEASLAKKGVQQVTVLSSPAGATVTIDDRPVGVTPFTGEFAPGQHQIGVSLRGYADSQQKVALPADDDLPCVRLPLSCRHRPGTNPVAARLSGSGRGTRAPGHQERCTYEPPGIASRRFGFGCVGIPLDRRSV